MTLPSNVLVSIFQSTHPVRGCDAQWSFGRRLQVLFQSTHPVRGATDKVCHNGGGNTISIHAPREGCDFGSLTFDYGTVISIHAPREGCDVDDIALVVHEFISIHAPREGCDQTVGRPGLVHGISIHAPREGCDFPDRPHRRTFHVFQSTHPVRGATDALDLSQRVLHISIHAPREGCDHVLGSFLFIHERISIHAPREGCDRENGLRIPRYGHSDHSLASIVLYNPLASPQIRKSAESKYQQIIHS